MIDKLKTALLNIEQKCETEARLYNERATKKRARDTANEEAGPSNERSKPSSISMVLNSNADREVAINKLFEAVNDVSKIRNMSELSMITITQLQIKAQLPPPQTTQSTDQRYMGPSNRGRGRGQPGRQQWQGGWGRPRGRGGNRGRGRGRRRPGPPPSTDGTKKKNKEKKP